MLIVRFVRNDEKPDEEYYYNTVAEAIYHIHLFINDTSGLYDRIELVVSNPSCDFEEIAYTLKYKNKGD